MTEQTCSNWFKRFKSGDVSLEDKEKSGRPTEVDLDQLRSLIEDDPSVSTRYLARVLGCSHSSIHRQLISLGKVCKAGRWIPHTLTDENRNARVGECNSLLRSRRDDWLDDIITSDEKWVDYENVTLPHEWLDPSQKPSRVPKPELHPKKVMVTVFWDSLGILYYELLPANTTITAEYYCKLLQKVKDACIKLGRTRDKVYLLHDNARPHVAKKTKEQLESLGWEMLPHPPYSPDISPTDYCLFRSMQHFLEGKHYKNNQEIYDDLAVFFASKEAQFYHDGIHSLHGRWRDVVEHDGDYIDDSC